MNLKTVVVASLVVLVSAPALAQDRHGTFILVRLAEREALSRVWLNTLHMHSIQPCYLSRDSLQDDIHACVHMDDDASSHANTRVFRSQ